MDQDSRSPGNRKPVSEYIDSTEEEGSEETQSPDAPEPQSRGGSLAIAIGIPAAVAVLGIIAVVIWFGTRDQGPEVETPLPDTRTASAPAQTTSSSASQSQQQQPSSDGSTSASSAQATQETSQAQETPQTSGQTSESERAAEASSSTTASGGGGADTASTASGASSPSSGNIPSDSWPQFRGKGRDAITTVEAPLSRDWDANPPEQLWSVDLGEGFAAPVVRDGKVYLLDYDQQNRADTLRCFSLANGQELWSQSYSVMIKRNHGMSRTVPTLSGQYCVTLGPKCDVMCTDAESGDVYWKMDLVEKYNAEVPDWYAGQNPLVEGDRVILAPAGSRLMVAVDIASGEVIWEAPNPMGWKMTHSSVRSATINGQKMYVYCASGGVVGVAPGGEILWKTDKWRVSTANIPTPVQVDSSRIFLTGGYNAGSMMLKLTGSGSNMQPTVDFKVDARTFSSHQHTPILYQNHLYGVLQSGELTCLDLQGNQLWTSGRTKRFGLGPYIIVNDLMYILSGEGELALVRPSPEGYNELTRTKILDGRDAWGPLAMVGGLLLARDMTEMVCLDVRAQ